MRDYFEIGCTPYDEPCAQVGADNYPEMSKIECRAYLNQIRRVVGPEPEGCYLTIKSFPHDFGSYREVCVVYDDDEESHNDYVLKCESCCSTWDDEARAELAAANYTLN